MLRRVGIPKANPPKIRIVITVKLFKKIENKFILLIGKKDHSDNFENLLHQSQ